ncbi:NERD domain-containing protein [Candidatus Bathyarchaeota archaeon]|nr:NERD domain-containing protein [Candidatus Bathyarchaeota archaeon]MBS7627836.1 NERD domain-containing protein [Candidatus Bathyarchaeota archaeon]
MPMESQPSKLRLVKELLRLCRKGDLGIDELIVAMGGKPWKKEVEQALKTLEGEGFLRRTKDQILLDGEQKLRLLVMGCELGGDVEELGRLIGWVEFEILIEKSLEAYGYEAIHAFRFRHGKRRWEIDLIALRNPLLLCIDCKHLVKQHGSSLKKGAEHNIHRARSLGESLGSLEEKLSLQNWRRALILPVIVCLSEPPFQDHKGCPIVPILRLRNFLSELRGHVGYFQAFFYRRNARREWQREIPLTFLSLESP